MSLTFAEGDMVTGVRLPDLVETHGRWLKSFGDSGAVIEADDGQRWVIANAERYVEPRWEETPIFDEVAAEVSGEWPVVESVESVGLVRRVVWRLCAVRWTPGRVTWGVSSVVAFVGTGALWVVTR